MLQIRPQTSYSQTHGELANDFVYKGMRTGKLGSSYPVPIHAVPPRTRNKIHRTNDWYTPKLLSVGSDELDKPPVPPPRKKRKLRVNSTEVLNSHLPELHSPSYVKSTETLWNKTRSNLNVSPASGGEVDAFHPVGKPCAKGRSVQGGVRDRFEKLSEKRMRKIKTDSYRNDPCSVEKIKNDNEKKTDQKIKHVSTVSLPNYNELIKRNRKVSADTTNGDDKNGNQSVGFKLPRRNSSTISLPGEGSNSLLSSLSEATIHCLETYMKRCRSFGSLKPQQLLEKLEEFNKTQRSASESSDSWCGLDEWDLGVIEHCVPSTVTPGRTAKGTNQNNRQRQVRLTVPQHAGKPKKESAEKSDKADETRRVRVPLEWFLNGSSRVPALTCGPAEFDGRREKTRTPPPSPETDASLEPRKESIKNEEEHSSLLKILGQYKEDESDESKLLKDVRKLVNAAVEDSQKDSMNFDEVDVEFSSKRNSSPSVLVKNRSNSLGDEISRTPERNERRRSSRSPSLTFGSPTSLLRQLQKNSEEIEREMMQRPNEMLDRLRRESLFRSLPKDAFEAFKKKKMTSLRDSLNEFLGFTDFQTENERSKDENAEEEKTEPCEKGRGEQETGPPSCSPELRSRPAGVTSDRSDS
ncbi:hypothetical protein RUM43_002791 [Polyplax serrata]|uniref:Uncharacterized protein n=1 Tax=Polyplax serrata TaxID=468196 RepID=A0AAN8S679_POLSC